MPESYESCDLFQICTGLHCSLYYLFVSQAYSADGAFESELGKKRLRRNRNL